MQSDSEHPIFSPLSKNSRNTVYKLRFASLVLVLRLSDVHLSRCDFLTQLSFFLGFFRLNNLKFGNEHKALTKDELEGLFSFCDSLTCVSLTLRFSDATVFLGRDFPTKPSKAHDHKPLTEEELEGHLFWSCDSLTCVSLMLRFSDATVFLGTFRQNNLKCMNTRFLQRMSSKVNSSSDAPAQKNRRKIAIHFARKKTKSWSTMEFGMGNCLTYLDVWNRGTPQILGFSSISPIQTRMDFWSLGSRLVRANPPNPRFF